MVQCGVSTFQSEVMRVEMVKIQELVKSGRWESGQEHHKSVVFEL
jgi:hypothetical protein